MVCTVPPKPPVHADDVSLGGITITWLCVCAQCVH